MESVFHVWITVSIACQIAGVLSSIDNRKRLCVSAENIREIVPKKRSACPEHYGILVEEISMTPIRLDEGCDEDDDDESKTDSQEWRSIDIHHFKEWRDHSHKIELYLKEACNGQRQCLFRTVLPSPIPLPKGLANDQYKVYLTYVIMYSCQPVEQEIMKNISVFDMANNDTVTVLEGTSTLVLKSQQPFDRHCLIMAPNGTVSIDPMWISFNHTKTQRDACLRVFGTGNRSVYDVGCEQAITIEDFQNSFNTFGDLASFHIIGDGGFVWIRVNANVPYKLSCRATQPDRSSPIGFLNRICIPSDELIESAPRKKFACEENYGIFVESIGITEHKLLDNCNNVMLEEDLHHDLSSLGKSRAIELALKQACNGNRRCIFPEKLPPPLPFPNAVNPQHPRVYSSYVVQYRCKRIGSGVIKEDVFDISQDFTFTGQTTTATLALKSAEPYRRVCTVRSQGEIYMDPLWVSIKLSTKRWDACVKIFQEGILEFDVGCDDVLVTKVFPYIPRQYFLVVTLDVVGNSGVVWLHLAGSSTYNITCQSKTIDQLTTKAPVVPASGNSTTSPGNEIKIAPSDSNETGGSPDVLIAVTATIALLATVVAICLVIYILYIRKSSGYQRRKLSRRLERQLTQRMQEGQHPRVNSQRQKSQQQQHEQQQQENGASPYDLYTYMDEKDIKGSPLPSKIGTRAHISLPGMTPNRNYSFAKPSQYSANYTFVQTSTTSEGEYNELGKTEEPRAGSAEGGTYDTVATGGYVHFDDVNKTTKIIGNFYDG